MEQVSSETQAWLDDLHNAMLDKQRKYLADNTRRVSNYEEFKSVIGEHKGFIEVYWNDDPAIEKRIKEETKASSRCRLKNDGSTGVDFVTGEPASERWVFAQSY